MSFLTLCLRAGMALGPTREIRLAEVQASGTAAGPVPPQRRGLLVE
jgi:hypothetical protein